MSRINLRRLVDRGRKAGLQTGELYQALAAHQPQAGDQHSSQTDGNGFVIRTDDQGRRVIQQDEHPRG